MNSIPNKLETPIEYLKGVGPQRADILKKELNIFTFGDLLQHYPFRYVDRSKIDQIRDIKPDTQYFQLKGKITNIEILGSGRGRRMGALICDGTGTVELIWFQGINWVQKFIRENVEYIVYGKPNFFKGKISIAHPELEAATTEEQITGFLQPVYNSTEKMKSKGLHSKGLMKLQRVLHSLIEKNDLKENVPDSILLKLKLLNRFDAIQNIHFPKDNSYLLKAQLRLKFEELFFIQLELLKIKTDRKHFVNGFILKNLEKYFNSFYKDKLPFPLTNAQKKVLKEIREDVLSGKQMNRLLQGDVGSGKTVVALMTMLMALDNNFQSCMMVPTEILAQQHYKSINDLLNGMEIKIALLTGSTKSAERKKILEQLAAGEIQILLGTHSLIEQTVQFQNLGLVIIDEQHRFGVEQRAKLWGKAQPLTSSQREGEKKFGPDLSERIGEKSKYQIARVSSYNLIKKLQIERKKFTTEAEEILWQYLRGKNFDKYKFRRQHIIDEFIVDFVCLSKKLIVEVDGKYHQKPEMIEADKFRTEFLNNLGYTVIRFTNEEIISNTENILEKIKDKLSRQTSISGDTSPIWREAFVPHILVMTATPIPRTLAMTLYGDLDISIIDEMPPGRKPITTVHRTDSSRLKVFGFFKEQINKGRQIYIVYPLIEESENFDYKDLMDGYESIVRAFPLPEFKVSIVHGQMKPEAKDYEMNRFVRGETNIMVATNVIEVGVNVPNASVMVIESAERFGLSQLHQLRGRVGRGAEQSYCILMTGNKLSNDARQRMQTMVATNDGFEIAEVDLKLRGPGDLQGTQQSGILNLKIADIARDEKILKVARNEANDLLKADPEMKLPVNLILKNFLDVRNRMRKKWGRIS